MRSVLLALVAFCSIALAGGWFGIRADYYYGGGFELVAVVEQTLFELEPFEFVAGVELRTPSLDWQPYSGINAYFDHVFTQFKWGTGWLSLQTSIRW